MNLFGSVLAAMVVLPPLAHAVPAQPALFRRCPPVVLQVMSSSLRLPGPGSECRRSSCGAGPVRLGGSRGASARYATRRYLLVTADNQRRSARTFVLVEVSDER